MIVIAWLTNAIMFLSIDTFWYTISDQNLFKKEYPFYSHYLRIFLYTTRILPNCNWM